MKKLWNKLFPRRTDKSGNQLVVDESDSLIISLGISIFFFSILVTFGWFNIPDPIFLATAVFALYFSLAMTYKNGTLKTIFLVLTFPATTYWVFIIQELTTDLNRVNNGLSLLALSLSLLFMPIKKSEEKTSEKISKIYKDTIDKQNAYIKTLEANNGRLGEINKNLIRDIERFSFEIDRLQIEVNEFENKKNDGFSDESFEEPMANNSPLSISDDIQKEANDENKE